MNEMIRRAHGSLVGLAIGDALGMPTQLLPRKQVAALFPSLADFAAGPSENAISAGQPAGSITDDTQQALIIAELLIEGKGHVDSMRFVEQLLMWARAAEAHGTEQLGPSSRRALEAIQQGSSLEEAGRRGDTNGAAMRIAPVGIATPVEPLELFMDHVEEVCRPTHFTGLAIAGAAAVAAAISACVSGASFSEAIDVARHAATLGQERGFYAPGPKIAQRISWAVEMVARLDEASAQDAISDLIGTGVTMQEAVPAAFALASRWSNKPWQACLIAAHLGGDSDTVGAITGSMLGACSGVDAFPERAVATVERVNKLYLAPLAQKLIAVRTSASEGLPTGLGPQHL